MLYLTYKLHREILEDKYAIISPLILATTFLWINYSNMATQDIVFSAIVTFGIYKTIKAYKYNKNLDIFFAGIWIGLGIMLKTYLIAIPLLPLLPFLVKKKIIFKKYYWIGLIIGIIPFLIWTGNIIHFYGFNTYSGLYIKLLTLSENNNFTKPFYYYLWNLPLNIFPWSLLTFIGLYYSRRIKIQLAKYFLFYYPIGIIILLSIFSTKTPYYTIQILSLLSINTFLGLVQIRKSSNLIIKVIKIFNFIIVPFLTFLIVFLIYSKKIMLDIDFITLKFLSIGFFIFSFFWLSQNFIKDNKLRLISILIGPYFLSVSLLQSGLITDKSKELRLAMEDLLTNESFRGLEIKTIRSEVNNESSYSKIIKILSQMPKIGKGIESIDELNFNEYAWTTSSEKSLKNKENIRVINNSNIFNPWKLILRYKN